MKHEQLTLEYEQINENIRWLADVRFKLLAWIPALGGVGAVLLSHMGLQAAQAAEPERLPLVLAGGVLGFLLTLGITLYDQRNSELYNALLHRAKHLERAFEADPTPGALKVAAVGGQFNERPSPQRALLLRAKHDVALALIYGSLLGVWWLPITYALAAWGLSLPHAGALMLSMLVAVALALAFTGWLAAIDAASSELYTAAAGRDGLG